MFSFARKFLREGFKLFSTGAPKGLVQCACISMKCHRSNSSKLNCFMNIIMYFSNAKRWNVAMWPWLEVHNPWLSGHLRTSSMLWPSIVGFDLYRLLWDVNPSIKTDRS